eukprot:10063303-Ditylum_brightwellii.AAC.1
MVEINQFNQKGLTTLNKFQQHLLRTLKDHPEFVIFLTDKNMGPAIIEQEEYVKRALKDHLSDKKSYKQLTNGKAKVNFRKTRNTVITMFLQEYKEDLSEWEMTFFERLLDIPRLRKPAFCILAKVHKLPCKIRPVVSSVGSLLAAVSTWLDYHLQKLRKFLPSFIKDLSELRKTLESNFLVEKDTAIFAPDATA